MDTGAEVLRACELTVGQDGGLDGGGSSDGGYVNIDEIARLLWALQHNTPAF